MQSYPINLLLQNRPCLVVGGGRVALRKATRLLKACARVKIVAPEAVTGLQELAGAGRLELILRNCQDDDLEGIFLAFFASDDHDFNQRMLSKAQRLGILSCAVDENWSAGDFITPASCDGAGLQFAIATGGQSCMRAKSVKNFLENQLETLVSELALTTFTISGAELGKDFNPELLASALASLKLISGVREFAGYFAAGNFELVTLLSHDEKVEHLVQLILGDTVSPRTGVMINERRGQAAFTYLLQKNLPAEMTPSVFMNCRVECRVGSGLKKLNSLLTRSETLTDDPARGWQEYADYCRKL